MRYFGSILSQADISPKNAHGWGLDLKEESILSKIIYIFGIPHTGARIRNRIILGIIKSKKIKSIIDIGGGIGLTGFYLNQFGYTYTGLDKSGYKIRIAKKLLKKSGNKNMSFIHANMYKQKSMKEKFDCALNMEVLEHVKDPKDMLKRISKVVKKNGYIILSFPSTHKINALSQKYFSHVRVGYEPKDIKGLIKGEKLKIENICTIGNSLLSKIGFYIDYLLIKEKPILAGIFFWLFYPVVVLDQRFIKSNSPLEYVVVIYKLK